MLNGVLFLLLLYHLLKPAGNNLIMVAQQHHKRHVLMIFISALIVREDCQNVLMDFVSTAIWAYISTHQSSSVIAYPDS